MKRKLQLSVVVIVLISVVNVFAGTIDFEGLPRSNWYYGGGQNFGSYWAGVTFGPQATILENQVYGYNSGNYPPRSGHAVLFSYSVPYIDVKFDLLVNNASFWYSSGSGLWIEAYDKYNNLITRSYGGNCLNRSCYLQVTSLTSNIDHLKIHDSGNFFTIDDFYAPYLSGQSGSLIPEGPLPVNLPEPKQIVYGGQLVNDNFMSKQNSMSWNPEKFDPSKPTIVIVHGWNSDNLDEFPKFAKEMGNIITNSAKNPNVVFWQWLDEAKGGLPPSTATMLAQGNLLAKSLDGVLNNNYNNKIHFIAHSAGSSVAYAAVNKLKSAYNRNVDALTLLDAYGFNGIKCDKASILSAFLSPNVSSILSACIIKPSSIFNSQLPKETFLDNYWSFVGGLSEVLSNLDNSISADAVISDNLIVLPYSLSYKDLVPSYPPDYFVNDYDSFMAFGDSLAHKPPVNWYMASMVDQLNPNDSRYVSSGRSANHKYGFYWSPILSNGSPAKGTTPLLLGVEKYFDLYSFTGLVKQAAQTVEVKVAEGVQVTADYIERITKKITDTGKSIYVKTVDNLNDATGWVADKAGNVVFSAINGWIWATSGSPVAFSKSYQIESGINLFAFSYEVLQADDGDTIEVFINDELVSIKTAEDDLGKGIIFSDLIDVSKWSGQAVNITFRINSFDGLSLIMKLHDLTFATSNKAQFYPTKLYGSAYNYPESITYKATFSLDVTSGTQPLGTLKYSYAKTRINLVSSAITSVSVSGNTATLFGSGSVNGVSGYTFTSIVSDASPDSFSIVIRKPDGTVLYNSGSASISGGNISITQL